MSRACRQVFSVDKCEAGAEGLESKEISGPGKKRLGPGEKIGRADDGYGPDGAPVLLPHPVTRCVFTAHGAFPALSWPRRGLVRTRPHGSNLLVGFPMGSWAERSFWPGGPQGRQNWPPMMQTSPAFWDRGAALDSSTAGVSGRDRRPSQGRRQPCPAVRSQWCKLPEPRPQAHLSHPLRAGHSTRYLRLVPAGQKVAFPGQRRAGPCRKAPVLHWRCRKWQCCWPADGRGMKPSRCWRI